MKLLTDEMAKKSNNLPIGPIATGKQLRRLVYTTILFTCLMTALYSIKALNLKADGGKNVFINLGTEKSELLRIRRESIENKNATPNNTKNNGNTENKGQSEPAALPIPVSINANGEANIGNIQVPVSSSTKKKNGTRIKQGGVKNSNKTQHQTKMEISSLAPGKPISTNKSSSLDIAIALLNATIVKMETELSESPLKTNVSITTTTTAATTTTSTQPSPLIPSSTTKTSTLSPISSTTTKTSTSSSIAKTSHFNNVLPSIKATKIPTSTGLPPQTTTEMPCDPPAYHEFPDDLFSNKQRAQGFVIIHVLVGIYMFYALAVVCDEYFVASMEKICQKMGLSEDVAGATFMAAGSSAPELFASLLGVFVAKGDVGTGTIVGSAVFNILFVIGFCGIFAGQVVMLNWWPLLRDSFYYSITVAVLIAVLADSYVMWWESVIMLLMYVIYIIIMKYNMKIHIWLVDNTRLRLMDEITQASQGILTRDEKQIRSAYVQFNNDAEEKNSTGFIQAQGFNNELTVDEIIRDFPRKMSLYEAALKVMSSRYFSPRTRFRCAGQRLIIEKRHLRKDGFPTSAVVINEYDNTGTHNGHGWLSSKGPSEDWKMAPSFADQGVVVVIKWFITIPVLATLHYTIPDCRNGRWERWYLLTFFTAMLWIAFFSYILVWMVTLVGYTCGVPDTVMGITFLAAGTSIPDAYSSLLVAKQGFGDMAVSNSIGSNVFDILVGLSLPWFLQTVIVEPNSVVPISSRGLVYNVLLLFLTIAATIAAVHYCHWQLSKKLGVTLLIAYAVFLVFSLLIEFNVFGDVNLPECDE